MAHTAGKIVSNSITMWWSISSKTPLLINTANYLWSTFKKCVSSFYFIAWWKYIWSVSDNDDLAYILVLLDILIFMAMISPGRVVTKAYYCSYVGNICTRLDLVLLLGWIASVCLSVTEDRTAGFLSGAGYCIGDLWVSYYYNGGTDACYYGSREL